MTVDSGGDVQWYFSQVKGTTEEEINEADIISAVEFNEDGELLATGDKGGRIVIFQREQASKAQLQSYSASQPANNNPNLFRTEYNVYSTFQSHEAEFDYLKSLEIEEKINKIKWLRRKNQSHFLLSTNDKTVKLWKIRERNKRAFMPPTGQDATSIYSSSSGGSTSLFNGDSVCVRDDVNGFIRSINIPVVKYMDRVEVEAVPKRVFANAHTYHINSISLNSDQETFMSADDLRINLWHIEITNQSFNIVDIKPANMEELTEVITAAEFHPKECNLFVYSTSKGVIRLCDMRQSALCDTQAKVFEEREDPNTKNFFSEIISSIADVKFSHSGRYLCTRDYLNVKVWDLNMESRPVETYSVHDYLRNKLCVLYENDCIFDKFECNWSANDDQILSGSYNNFFKSFNRNTKQEVMYECSREQARPRQQLRPKRVTPSLVLPNGTAAAATTTNGGSSSPSLNKRMLNGGTNGTAKTSSNNNLFKDEINVDSLDFTKKILHTSWHPKDNIIAIAATNNLYIYYTRENSLSNHMNNLTTSSYATNSTAASSTAANALTSNNSSSMNSIVNSESSCLTLNTSFYTPSSNSTPTSTTTTTTNNTNTSSTNILTTNNTSVQPPASTLLTSSNNNPTTTNTTTTLTSSSNSSCANAINSVQSPSVVAQQQITLTNSMSL